MTKCSDCDETLCVKCFKAHSRLKLTRTHTVTHKSTFNKVPDSHTTLSSYIWKLKDKGIPYEVKRSIKARGHAFSSGGQACDLCLTEKH